VFVLLPPTTANVRTGPALVLAAARATRAFTRRLYNQHLINSLGLLGRSASGAASRPIPAPRRPLFCSLLLELAVLTSRATLQLAELAI
jgi:hypothetical protein